MNDEQIPLIFEYNGEQIEIDEELRNTIPRLGKYSWCITLKEFPQLAQFCTCWKDLPTCGAVWDDLMKKRPELYSYVVATL